MKNLRNTTVCIECGKGIRRGAEAVFTNPPVFLLRLGEFPKAYHPACYAKAEKKAEREVNHG